MKKLTSSHNGAFLCLYDLGVSHYVCIFLYSWHISVFILKGLKSEHGGISVHSGHFFHDFRILFAQVPCVSYKPGGY